MLFLPKPSFEALETDDPQAGTRKASRFQRAVRRSWECHQGSVDLSIPRLEVYGSLTTGDACTDTGMVPALPNLDTHLLLVLVLAVVVVRVIMEGIVVVVVVVVVVVPS